MIPLFAALLFLPLGSALSATHPYPPAAAPKNAGSPAHLAPGRTGKHPVLFVLEDLHWVDPSTMELLNLAVDQSPTAGI